MATKYVDRQIPKISLRDFENRIDEITSELSDAAENVGFFSIVEHGITQTDIDKAFARSQAFFSLPDDVKATVPWSPQNVGWEKNSQIRPSTGAPDNKESYQLQYGENMLSGGKGDSGYTSMWMSDIHLPGFKDDCLEFMHQIQEVSNKLMVCLARSLGFPDAYFLQSHDPSDPKCQTVLRLLHYFPTPQTNDGKVWHRAGAHADWGLITLLFQREGESGLEICPGREAVTEFGLGDTWTKVNFEPGAIICNIGDMLMRWSDDRFKSTFHRVKAPSEPGDYFGERYSIAYFTQPSKDSVIQGPKKKYSEITGRQFIANAMNAHFAALKKKVENQDGQADKIPSTESAPVVKATA
ncbi:leucoanthocyanidin dioxygenase [Diaporthe eres]|uniref:Fe2OG dioxygenase domain-containing protein n=1 Tax=Diaporthe vaccinii TaxID=105482 RepID=A0ABR4EIG9_9PEZI|nr:leucoanthocyanidin dioxygenase [Diaporthe eres]